MRGGPIGGQPYAGGADAYLAKYDASGNQQWVRLMGSAAFDVATGVALDKAGSIYLVGYTHGALPAEKSAGGADAFIVKYGPAGNRQWQRQFGTAGKDNAWGVAVTPTGDVVVLGSTEGSLGGPARTGPVDLYVRKYDASGNEIWTRQIRSVTINWPSPIGIDENGTVVITGAGGDPTGSQPGMRVAVWKYDVDGNEVSRWNLGRVHYGPDGSYGATFDRSGNVLVIGLAVKPAGQPGRGGPEGFVEKRDGDGKLAWTGNIQGNFWYYPRGVAVDRDGGVVVAGVIKGNLPGKRNQAGTSVLLRRFDAAGNETWAGDFGSDAQDEALGVASDKAGNIYIAGFAGPLPGQTFAGGYSDAFIRKYNSAGRN